jgi:hypothetical protein
MIKIFNKHIGTFLCGQNIGITCASHVNQHIIRISLLHANGGVNLEKGYSAISFIKAPVALRPNQEWQDLHLLLHRPQVCPFP